jgi:rubredoxin
MTETLIDSRCPLCQWTGVTDDETCPECGHGLVDYKVVKE